MAIVRAGGAALRPHLPAAEVQDRLRRSAGQRHRRLHPGSRLHRHRRTGEARRLQRHDRRRHGPHRPRAEDLSAARRRHRLHRRGPAARRRRRRHGGPARLRQPRRPQHGPLQIHHRRQGTRLDQGARSSGASASPLEPARPFAFTTNGDEYGWVAGTDGAWHYTLFIENGRVANRREAADGRRCGRSLASIEGEFRVTPNQNLVIANVAPAGQAAHRRTARRAPARPANLASALRLNSMACVGLPTCALAMAESERYLPSLVRRSKRCWPRTAVTSRSSCA